MRLEKPHGEFKIDLDAVAWLPASSDRDIGSGIDIPVVRTPVDLQFRLSCPIGNSKLQRDGFGRGLLDCE